VAGYLLIRHHSAVELIDRCEPAGLVWRERDSDDRRVVGLRLSPDGHMILADLSGAHLEELVRFTPLFEAMLDALGTPTDREAGVPGNDRSVARLPAGDRTPRRDRAGDREG
jgi:hypothetical protein